MAASGVASDGAEEGELFMLLLLLDSPSPSAAPLLRMRLFEGCKARSFWVCLCVC